MRIQDRTDDGARSAERTEAAAPGSLAGPARRRARHTLAICLVLALAAVLRLVALDRVPPGLQHDEVFGAVFAEMVLAGEPLFFLDMNGGNEPLFLYLVTGAMAAFGRNLLALRLPAVAGGLLTIAATYWVLRRLLGPRQALAAAFLMSVSLWLVLDSRVSLRAIWLPAVAALSYGFMWRWLRRRRGRWLALAAVLLGLSLYTYTSSALGLATVAALALWYLVIGRDRRAAGGLALMALLAALMGAPLARHMASVPDAGVRVRALSYELQELRAGNPWPVLTNTARVLGMFAFVGDPEWRYNVAGRPVFALPVGLLFYLGVAVSLRRFRRAEYAFLLFWLVANLGASAVTGSAPSSLRAVGAAPAAFALAAVGAVSLVEAAGRASLGRAAAPALVGAAMIFEAGDAIGGYFVTWPANPEVRRVYLADLAETARYLRQGDAPDEVLVSSEYAADLDRQCFEYLGFTDLRPRWFDARHSLVLPEQPALLVVPHQRPVAGPLVPVLAEVALEEGVGGPSFRAWRVAAGQEAAQPLAYAAAPWGARAVTIETVTLPATAPAGGALSAIVRWRVTAQAAGGHYITFFAHLVDEAGLVWSQADVLAYPSSDWRLGDEVYQLLELPLPADMPPGRARLRLGLYEDAARPLPLELLPQGAPFWYVDAGEVAVVPGERPARAADIAAPQPLNVALGHGLRLAGASVEPRIVEPGGRFEVATWWEATATRRPAALDYRLERQGEVVILGGGETPSGYTGVAGQVLRRRQVLRAPADLGRGVWRLVLGSPDEPSFRVDLGEVFAAGVERSFEAPAPEVALQAAFAEPVTLLGADLPASGVTRGSALTVVLYWQSRGPLDVSYTVFVHLLDGEGRVVAGADALPAAGARPTTGWLPGEVVRDEHALAVGAAVAPGRYRLVAGLYRADQPGYPRVPLAGGGDAVPIGEIEVVE